MVRFVGDRVGFGRFGLVGGVSLFHGFRHSPHTHMTAYYVGIKNGTQPPTAKRDRLIQDEQTAKMVTGKAVKQHLAWTVA